MFFAAKPEQIIAFDRANAIVKDAVRQVTTAEGYLKLGDYLRNLSDMDLRALLSMIVEAVDNDQKDTDTDTDDAGMNLVLLTTVLSNAEGVGFADAAELHKQTKFLMLCITLERFAREGHVHFYRENATFTNIDQNLPIAVQIDKLH